MCRLSGYQGVKDQGIRAAGYQGAKNQGIRAADTGTRGGRIFFVNFSVVSACH